MKCQIQKFILKFRASKFRGKPLAVWILSIIFLLICLTYLRSFSFLFQYFHFELYLIVTMLEIGLLRVLLPLLVAAALLLRPKVGWYLGMCNVAWLGFHLYYSEVRYVFRYNAPLISIFLNSFPYLLILLLIGLLLTQYEVRIYCGLVKKPYLSQAARQANGSGPPPAAPNPKD